MGGFRFTVCQTTTMKPAKGLFIDYRLAARPHLETTCQVPCVLGRAYHAHWDLTDFLNSQELRNVVSSLGQPHRVDEEVVHTVHQLELHPGRGELQGGDVPIPDVVDASGGAILFQEPWPV